jgi:cytidylate kinase
VIITISRMFGSGGSDVAARVARQLGWSLLDNAMVDAVAERIGIPRSEVSKIEERVPSLVERISATLRMSTPEYVVPVTDAALVETTEERVVEMTKSVIREAVQQGNAVLVGRGAQCMLADRPDALHVFCYAPMASLVEYAIAHRGVDAANATQEVVRMNKQREQYVKRHWGRDWKSFDNYHLCLDTARLGLDGAANLVLHAARARFTLS